MAADHLPSGACTKLGVTRLFYWCVSKNRTWTKSFLQRDRFLFTTYIYRSSLMQTTPRVLTLIYFCCVPFSKKNKTKKKQGDPPTAITTNTTDLAQDTTPSVMDAGQLLDFLLFASVRLVLSRHKPPSKVDTRTGRKQHRRGRRIQR